jgi:hypothetical protein
MSSAAGGDGDGGEDASGTDATDSAGAAAALGAVEGANRVGATPVVKVRSTVPSLTRSPSLIFNSCTTPPSGEGTSIEALSDSRVTSGCSALTVSPALTMTSMIGTSLNSPMSGTRTSATPAGALVGAGGGETAGLTGFAAGPASSGSRLKIGVPWLTLSPILIATLFTTPAYGDGTSIDALSDSSVMSGASASTQSPGFTWSSMTGTSLKAPISGTRTCLTSPITMPRSIVLSESRVSFIKPSRVVVYPDRCRIL